jgi:hypothetical protein
MIAPRFRVQGRRTQRARHHHTIDLWRHFRPLAAHDEARNVRARNGSPRCGGVRHRLCAVRRFFENLIEGLNIVGSIFYGVRAGRFRRGVLSETRRRHGGFSGRRSAQILVFALYFLGKASPRSIFPISGIIHRLRRLRRFQLVFQMIFGDKAKTNPTRI